MSESGKIISCEHGIIIIDTHHGGVICDKDDVPKGMKVKKGDTVEYEFTGDHHDCVYIIDPKEQ